MFGGGTLENDWTAWSGSAGNDRTFKDDRVEAEAGSGMINPGSTSLPRSISMSITWLVKKGVGLDLTARLSLLLDLCCLHIK